MATKANGTVTPVAPEVTPERLALFQEIVNAQVSERANWEKVATICGIAIVVEGKKTENPAAKTVAAQQFVDVYVAKHAPLASKESKDYTEAVKDGRATFSTCINRALVRMGNRPESNGASRKRSNESTDAKTTPQSADTQKLAKALEFNATVLSAVHEAQRAAKQTVEALTLFAAESKLTKKQTEAFSLLLQVATITVEATNAIESTIVDGPKQAPDKALEDALNKSLQKPKPDKPVGATVQ